MDLTDRDESVFTGFKDMLLPGCKELGIELSEDKKEQLFDFYRMVIEKNKVMNLTSITSVDGFAIKHVVDSLSIVKCLDMSGLVSGKHKCRMIDVGTGAGFPGMVLKIVYPELDVTLFDSLRKRLDFLDDAAKELGLEDIRTVHGRAEDFGRDKAFREKFDLVCSRAVSNMSTLTEYCLPFAAVGGIFAAYKSEDTDDEIKAALPAIRILGGNVEKDEKFTIQGDGRRRMLIIRKIRKTPMQYPRKAGVPAKTPVTG